jgi:hypothetical protein
MKEKVIHSLSLVGVHFWNFVKRLYLFAFFWGRYACVSYPLAIIIPMFLGIKLGLPYAMAMTITKVLLTIAPLLPTAVYAECKEEDYEDEFSMDLCFATWMITIVYAWWIM